MLFLVNNNFPTAVHPQLSRVWIKTNDPKMPLKSVWINEAQLHGFGSQACIAERESETRELADDHLALAA
ncbi:MAG TPA: hypothetical protein VMD98_10790 [Bryocella sp.]|nr:hypothetical protein [Bryocella sp.]